jgi:iron complex outermembrane recepter protein
MLKTRRPRCSRVAVAASMGLMPAVFALAAENEYALQEIVVTAQKRAENVQDVPIAITTFNDNELKSHGIADVQGLARLTPNVNIDSTSPFSGTASMLSASIRGIGQDDFAFNLDPGVGVYVDGVYYARTVGANQDLLDVDRVEVLKGPQGTLFGRNTIGGAISIVTHTPGDTLMVRGQVTTGSYDRHDISLMADIPLAPNLLSSVTFSSQQREGFERRIPYPSTTPPFVSDPVNAFHNSSTEAFDTQGGQNQQTIRAKVLWKVADNVTATATADWTHTNEPSPATTVLKTYSPAQGGVFNTFYNLCIEGVPFVPTAPLVCGPRGVVGTSLWNANSSLTSQRLPYGNNTAMTGNIDTTYNTGPNFDKINSYGTALTLDWKLNDSLSLRSITGWREVQWAAGSDLSGSADPMIDLTFAEGQRQISQEVQLLGDALDSKLHYVAGVYYFNESGFIHDYVVFGDGLLQIDGPNSLRTESYAGFLHADYAVTDHLGLTLGGRYSEDRKTYEGGQQELNDFFYKISGCYPPNASAALIGAPATLTCRQALGFTNPNNPEQVYPLGVNHQNFSVFTPAAGIQYHFTKDIMGYLGYSKGFKTGGWTTRLTAPLPPGSSAPTFGPETDNTYELGLKSEWFSHTLLANVALFFSRYQNIQLTYQLSTSPVTQNAGDADIKGAEFELQSRLGEHLVFNANAGFMDAYYTSILPPARATTGPVLPKTPKWKISTGPEWHTAFADGKILRIGADYTYTARMFNDVENQQIIARNATNIVNARIILSSADDRLTLTVGGTNLTNDRYLTTGNNNFAAGVATGYFSAPHEWFATLGLKL